MFVFAISLQLYSSLTFTFRLQPGDYSISLKDNVRNKHFWVQVDRQSGAFVIGTRSFKSMDALIQHYMKMPIFSNEATKENLYLIRPLPKYWLNELWKAGVMNHNQHLTEVGIIYHSLNVITKNFLIYNIEKGVYLYLYCFFKHFLQSL